jgi:hypothetical protein
MQRDHAVSYQILSVRTPRMLTREVAVAQQRESIATALAQTELIEQPRRARMG